MNPGWERLKARLARCTLDTLGMDSGLSLVAIIHEVLAWLSNCTRFLALRPPSGLALKLHSLPRFRSFTLL
jgi:hypothetical protein